MIKANKENCARLEREQAQRKKNRGKGRTAVERIGKGSGRKGRQIPQSIVQDSAGNSLYGALEDNHETYGVLIQREICL